MRRLLCLHSATRQIPGIAVDRVDKQHSSRPVAAQGTRSHPLTSQRRHVLVRWHNTWPARIHPRDSSGTILSPQRLPHSPSPPTGHPPSSACEPGGHAATEPSGGRSCRTSERACVRTTAGHLRDRSNVPTRLTTGQAATTVIGMPPPGGAVHNRGHVVFPMAYGRSPAADPSVRTAVAQPGRPQRPGRPCGPRRARSRCPAVHDRMDGRPAG
jgi:hypothetical protein